MIEAHFESALSDEQRNALAEHLKLSSEVAIVEADMELSHIVKSFNDLRELSDATPKKIKAFTAAEEIARLARGLLKHLRENSSVIHSIEWQLGVRCSDRTLSMDESVATGEKSLGQLNVLLEGVVAAADNYPSWDKYARRAAIAGSSNTEWLWPQLFALWASHRDSVGYSEGGPLARFVAFAHTICGLEPPNENSLKVAARNWRITHT